jgi:lysophospholipase L1-like esterase
LPEFKKNLIKLVQHPSVVAQNPKLILIAPAPIQESKQRYIDDIRENGPKRTAENTKRYADAVRERGSELGIPVLDLWTIFAEKAGWKAGMPIPGSLGDDNPVLEQLLADGKRAKETRNNASVVLFTWLTGLKGLHFAPAGYRLMYDEFMNLIQRTWPDQMPQHLPLPLPIWNDDDAWKRWDG